MKTSELIEKYGIRANKNFGQNFLHRDDIIETIADAAKGTPSAFEIGAGLGVLSRKLCDVFEKVVTIEIDKSLSEVTKETLKDVTNHSLVYQNFLKTDIPALCRDLGGAVTAVGNLPYNITGEIIAKLIRNHDFMEKAVVMVQKEAAEKFAAETGSENYRAISVLTQYFCNIETVCDVSPDCFIPAPRVTSRVIKLEFKKDLPIPKSSEKDFYGFVHTVFSKRRKLLTASMKTAESKEKAVKTLEKMGLCPKIRGEEMSHTEFAEFYKLMFCE